MVISKSLYLCGEFGGVYSVIDMIKAGNCPSLYFIYKTNNHRFLYQIGTYRMIMAEKGETVILGIAETKQYAYKIVCHIIDNMAEDK